MKAFFLFGHKFQSSMDVVFQNGFVEVSLFSVLKFVFVLMSKLRLSVFFHFTNFKEHRYKNNVIRTSTL